jgi:hypothetical protein
LTDEAPKSAYELAMERLRRKDQEEGVPERPVTDVQRETIAEIRRVAEARLAEREILHAASLRRTADPEAAAALEEEYRQDRQRIVAERDRRIEEVRKGP